MTEKSATSKVHDGSSRYRRGGTTAVDEIIVVSSIYDHAARLRSYEMLADAFAPRW